MRRRALRVSCSARRRRAAEPVERLAALAVLAAMTPATARRNLARLEPQPDYDRHC